MAPGLDVELRELRDMAQDMVDTSTAFQTIGRFVSETKISELNWPKQAQNDAGAEYKSASSTIEEVAHAVQKASSSIALSLEDVLRYYDVNEEYSSVIKPSFPPSSGERPASGKAFIAPLNVLPASAPYAEIFGTAALVLRRVRKARLMVTANARAIGPLAAFFLLVDGVHVSPNVRDPDPFAQVRDTWRVIADENVKFLRERLEGLLPIRAWDGDAAASFNQHMWEKFLPALEQLESVARSMSDLSAAIATGINDVNVLWLVLLTHIGVSLFIVRFYEFTSPVAFQLVITATILLYLVHIIAIIDRLNTWTDEMKERIWKIKAQADELAALCIDDTQTLDQQRNRVRPQFTMVSQDWSKQEWNTNWHPLA
jgi:uncharacterized protein YukE